MVMEYEKQKAYISFLPNHGKRRKAYISTLKKVADKFKDRPFSYLWAQGGSHAGLESSVGVGGFGEYLHWFLV